MTFPLATFMVAVQPFSLEYVAGSYTVNTANLTTYTFNNVPFGAAEANRILIVMFAIARSGSQGTHSVTIAGNAPTTLQSNGTNCSVSLSYLKVPTGTDGTIEGQSSAGSAANAAVAVFRLVGQTSDTPFHSQNPAGGGDGSRSITINVPSDGGVCAVAIGNEDSGSGSWTNATPQYGSTYDGNAGTWGSLFLGGPQTGRVITHSDCRAICGLSWG